jgi:hypothetical protein
MDDEDRSALAFARAGIRRSPGPEAWSNLAAAYATSTPPDLKRARAWYRRAALKGHKRGLFEYGLMMIHGEGGPKKPAQGLRYLERAAAVGMLDAWTLLASFSKEYQKKRRRRVKNYGLAERVYVENHWYDGPRSGVANINGVPHRFQSLFDEADDEYLGTFLVWPIGKTSLRLEIEQWRIFVEWYKKYESDNAGTESHPATGGIHKRWDELQTLLRGTRSNVPIDARLADAELKLIPRRRGYQLNGPNYQLRWSVRRGSSKNYFLKNKS